MVVLGKAVCLYTSGRRRFVILTISSYNFVRKFLQKYEASKD